jgi:hypothetical protein
VVAGKLRPGEPYNCASPVRAQADRHTLPPAPSAYPLDEIERGRAPLFAEASVAIDDSKFKTVNNRDKNLTRAKMQRRVLQIEESVARYLHQLDSADR